MDRKALNSSHLASVGFEPNQYGTGTLEVEFQGGAVYQYRNVPKSLHDELLVADSPGRHFRQFIKGRFSHERQ
jgi:KTSC domain